MLHTESSSNNLNREINYASKWTWWTYPTVSCLGLIGTTPALLVSPTVGFIPTTELESEGHKIDPSVSVPSDTATKLAATDIADPLLDPQGSPIVYGFCRIKAL